MKARATPLTPRLLPCDPQRAQDQGRPHKDKRVVGCTWQSPLAKSNANTSWRKGCARHATKGTEPRPRTQRSVQTLRLVAFDQTTGARAKERGCHQPSRSGCASTTEPTARASLRPLPSTRRMSIFTRQIGECPSGSAAKSRAKRCEKRIARGMGNPAGERGLPQVHRCRRPPRGSQSRDVEHHQNQESQPGRKRTHPAAVAKAGTQGLTLAPSAAMPVPFFGADLLFAMVMFAKNNQGADRC